jgi:AcrR family transcriptional regulator
MNSTDVKKQIKEKAMELFFRHGFRNVSLNELAEFSGISKSTINHSYENINAVIESVVDDLIRSHDDLFIECQRNAVNAIDEVIRQDNETMGACKGIRTSFFIDLETHLPELWIKIEQYKRKILEGVISNLERGKTEGYYKKEVDVELTAHIRLQQIGNLLQPQFLKRFSPRIHQLAGELTLMYLQSIATEKGKSLLHTYVEKKELY